ncbi:MAG: S41 family peptidase [Bacteroidia bacterium]
MQVAKGISFIGLGVALLLMGIVFGFRLRDPMDESLSYDAFQKFKDIVELVNRYYYREISKDDLVEKAINGMMEQLDPHTFYIPPEQNKREEAEMSGGFEGIGIEFQIVDDTIQVVTAIPGGPSELIGIQSGDRIVWIDSQVVASKKITNNDVIRLLRGRKGTKVKVGIVRPGVPNILEFTIVRDRIPMHAVNFSGLINGVGYIQLTRFSENSHYELRKALQDLLAQNPKGIILDLRNNPGGYLHMAQRIADEFISEGKKIVYTEGRVPESKSSYISTSYFGLYEEGPLVILINAGSASASEIVAGAVQDWDRGLIIGQRSFGKGVVQTQRLLPDSSAIRITYSRYYTPSGRCIQKPFEGKSSEEYERDLQKRIESGELLDASKIPIPDSLKYKTARGRLVYGGGGIIPDIFIPMDTTRVRCLAEYRKVSTFYVAAQEILRRFTELKQTYPQDTDFIEKFTPSRAMLTILHETAKQRGITCTPNAEAEKELALELKAILAKLLYGEEGRIRTYALRDPMLQVAIRLIPAAQELQEKGTFDNQKYRDIVQKTLRNE